MQNIVKKLRLLAKGSSLPWQQFKRLTDPEEMHEMAWKYLPHFGKGTARAVYRVGSSKVLKIALNPAGRAQNRAELAMWTDPQVKPVITHIFDADKRYNWIVAEVVQAYNNEDKLLADLGLGDIDVNFSMQELAVVIDDPDSSVYKIDETHPVVQTFRLLKKKYGAIINATDFYNLNHWGKTLDGRAVYLDYGYTEEIDEEFYAGGHPSKGEQWDAGTEFPFPFDKNTRFKQLSDEEVAYILTKTQKNKNTAAIAKQWVKANEWRILEWVSWRYEDFSQAEMDLMEKTFGLKFEEYDEKSKHRMRL